MNSVRRSIAGLAAAGLTASGLAVLGVAGAPAAQAAPITIDDATFTWGLNNEANHGAFAPGTWNLMSAGKIGNPGAGGKTLKTADAGATWSNNAAAGWNSSTGNVTLEDKQADGSYAPATFEGTRTDSTGAEVTAVSTAVAETRLAFKNGTGIIDSAANTASLAWDGDATVLFYSGMTFLYLSDPELTVEADGSGEVTALVDGFATAQDDPDEWTDLTAERVTIATLSDVDVDEFGFTATPAYREVTYTSAAAGPPQVTAGANWGAFPSDFIAFAEKTGTGPYWYSTGGAADAHKPAQPLGVTWQLPTVEVSHTEVPDTGTTQVTLTGTGFLPTASGAPANPAGLSSGGVYVALGRFADVWKPSASAQGSARTVKTQLWALPQADRELPALAGQAASLIPLSSEGGFTATFNVTKADFDALEGNAEGNIGIYTYTRKADLPAFETFTPITFTTTPPVVTPPVVTPDPPVASTVSAKWNKKKKPTTKKAGKLKVSVVAPGAKPSGKVVVTIKKANGKGKAKVITITLKANGTAVAKIGKLKAGKYKITLAYAGSTAVKAASTTIKVKTKR